MVKRTYNLPQEEPENMKFELPSVKEHLLQVTDVYTNQDETGRKFNLDDDTVVAKCEVVGGDEEGRTLLQRCSLDQNWKGFFATRLFLKAIGEEYKGDISIDSDNWIGRQFYADVVHNENKGKTYANIDTYNYEKKIVQTLLPKTEAAPKKPEDIAWDD